MSTRRASCKQPRVQNLGTQWAVVCWVFVLAVVITAGCGVVGQSPSGTNPIELQDGPSMTIVPPPAVPTYPGSVFTSRKGDEGALEMEYSTTDSPDAVYEFYKRELPKNGWKIARQPWGNGLSYEVDPKEGQANGYQLHLTAEVKGDKTSIWMFRNLATRDQLATPLPEPTIPVYPGAQVTGTKKELQGEVVVTTSYTTKDSPEAVVAFYRDSLPKYGWRVAQDPYTPPAVLYYLVYSYGFKPHPDGYYADVRVSKDGTETSIEVSKVYFPPR